MHEIKRHFRNHQAAEVPGTERLAQKQSPLDGAEAEANESALAEGARV